MLSCKRALVVAVIQSAWLCGAMAADREEESRTGNSPSRELEEFRFEDYEYSGNLREMEQAVRAGLLRAFPVGSHAELLIALIERREPLRGRYCMERTEDMVWCQYWHPYSADPRISIMYWVRIYHAGESRKIRDIGVKVMPG
jgi:hypothetical protein